MGKVLNYEITRVNAALLLSGILLIYIIFNVARCSGEIKLISERNKDDGFSDSLGAMLQERAARNNLKPIINILIKSKDKECDSALYEETASIGALDVKDYCVCPSGPVLSNNGCPKGCKLQTIPKTFATVWKNTSFCIVRLSNLVVKYINPTEKCPLRYNSCSNKTMCVLETYPCPITSLTIGTTKIDQNKNWTIIGNIGTNNASIVAYRDPLEEPIVKLGVSLNGVPCFDVLKSEGRFNGNVNIYNVLQETSCGAWGSLDDKEISYLDEELELDYLIENGFDLKLSNITDYGTNISIGLDKMQLFAYKKVPINYIYPNCKSSFSIFENGYTKSESLEKYRRGISTFFIIAFVLTLIGFLIYPLFYFYILKMEYDKFTESFILVSTVFVITVLVVILNSVSVSKVEDLKESYQELKSYFVADCFLNYMYNKIILKNYQNDLDYVNDIDSIGNSLLIFGIVIFAMIVLYYIDIFGPNNVFDPPGDTRLCEELDCNNNSNSNNNSCSDCTCEVIDCFT